MLHVQLARPLMSWAFISLMPAAFLFPSEEDQNSANHFLEGMIAGDRNSSRKRKRKEKLAIGKLDRVWLTHCAETRKQSARYRWRSRRETNGATRVPAGSGRRCSFATNLPLTASGCCAGERDLYWTRQRNFASGCGRGASAFCFLVQPTRRFGRR